MTRNVALTNEPPRGAATKIQRWAAGGTTKTGIAKNFGVSLKTLNAWMQRNPELQSAWDEGLEEEHAKIHKRAMQLIDEGNPTMIIFMLKARHNYREHAPVETPQAQVNITLPGARPVVREAVTIEQGKADAGTE
ncbi:MAG: hypothetical protein DI562_06075 [Stenotrophomonas acidaminiphila]|nr:MAG: hypothetical protein DI562_06075 [Stenotrophomonas acidaminiphila]